MITSVQRRRRWSTEEKVRILEEMYLPGNSVSLVARRFLECACPRWGQQGTTCPLRSGAPGGRLLRGDCGDAAFAKAARLGRAVGAIS
jgi:hypothetical protein